MKLLPLILALCTAPTAAFALPVVGEEVVYVGQALKADGLYDVKKTIRVEAYDPEKREYKVLNIFEQSAEGAPLGSIHETETVPLSRYAAVELQLIPALSSSCGESFPTHIPDVEARTAPETVETPLGSIETCRITFPTADGIMSSSWISQKTAPWPVKNHDQSPFGTYMTLTLQSHTRP